MPMCKVHNVDHSAAECRRMKSHDRRRQRREARNPSPLPEDSYLNLFPPKAFELARRVDPRIVKRKTVVLDDIELTANRKLYLRASEENRRRLQEALTQDRRA
jgi:hypothetical protein